METQAQAVAVLHAQAGMQLFLAVMMLLAHLTSQRLKADRGTVWFAAGSASGGFGLLLQSALGTVPPLMSVIGGNALLLVEFLCITKAIGVMTRQRCRWMLSLQLLLSAGMLGLLAWFTWRVPLQSTRVLVALIFLPLVLSKTVVLLLRSWDKSIRPATLTLAGLLSLLGLGMLGRAWEVAHGQALKTGANWSGTIFISGTAICFFWIDSLRMNARLESEAMSDPLTGLLNRRAIETFARRELARCQRQGQAIAALMIDMNGFKQVNDTHGHGVGDEALSRVADAIRGSLRAVDLPARIGGDEFLVLLPDASDVTVRTVTRRLHQAINGVEVQTGSGIKLQVSATIGRSQSCVGDVTLQDLMQHSDEHLYEQRRESREMQAAALPLELLLPAEPRRGPKYQA